MKGFLIIQNADKHSRTKIALSERHFDTRKVLILGSRSVLVYQNLIRLCNSYGNWYHSFNITALSYYVITGNLPLLAYQHPRTCRVPHVTSTNMLQQFVSTTTQVTRVERHKHSLRFFSPTSVQTKRNSRRSAAE